MGDSTIDSELFTLENNLGIAPSLFGFIPKDGFTGSEHHNVASPAYPPGTCVQVQCSGAVGKAGPSTLAYLKVGTQNADSLIAAKSVCVPDSATTPYVLTNDPDSCIKLPTDQAAIALSAMMDGYYGWFWIGGVCPEQYVSGLGGNYATDGALAAGPICAHDLTADCVGLSTADTAGEYACGFALAADA